METLFLSPEAELICSSDGKESACNARDLGLILGSGRRYPGEGNVNPLQYSRLENSMDRGAWRATVHGVAQSTYTHRNMVILILTSKYSYQTEKKNTVMIK